MDERVSYYCTFRRWKRTKRNELVQLSSAQSSPGGLTSALNYRRPVIDFSRIISYQ
jgi:hypothetical protein